MNMRGAGLSCLGIALLFAAVLPAADVTTDYDRSADFGQLRTYSWRQVAAADPLLVNRIRVAVDSVLAARGWTQVETDGDVAVVAIEMTHNRQTLNTFYDGFGGGWRWGGNFGTSTTRAETYKVGTLVVDLFNAKTKGLIWRGSASDTLSSKSSKNIKNLDKDVQKMFQHFPPEPGK
ncbi:MAG: DUF4136 domain-containing protein [Bryobacteraceae bacterium]|nr:DUF4136 domain-containing protein [Bryobacteraceae bacterium]